MRVFTQKEKHFVGTAILIAFCILFFAFFETSSQLSLVLQAFIITCIFFLILPVTYVRLVLREPLAHLGFRRVNNPWGVSWAALGVLVGFLSIWFLVRTYPTVASETLFPVLVETKFPWFIAYALTLMPLTILIYEVFFRGMIQILWLQNSWLAVFVQFFLFGGLLLVTGGFVWASAPLVIVAIVAGIVAKQTQSLWYAILTSYLITFSTDILFLSLR